MAAPPLLNRPRLRQQDLEFLDAYDHLTSARTAGVASPDPIQVSEILALCQLLGIASVSDRAKYLRIIQKMDRTFLEHWETTRPKN